MANKHKLPSAEKIDKKRRKHETKLIFGNGRQKRGQRLPATPSIESIPIADFIAQNADPIWLLQNGFYELLDEQYANADDGRGGIVDGGSIPF
jgi:hypothetical protein